MYTVDDGRAGEWIQAELAAVLTPTNDHAYTSKILVRSGGLSKNCYDHMHLVSALIYTSPTSLSPVDIRILMSRCVLIMQHRYEALVR